MNRDAKTQSALIALARSRRTQRALAHAFLHRNAALTGVRGTLGFVTSTACVTQEAAGVGHQMSILGVAPSEGVAYVVEELGNGEAPIAYRLWLSGPRHGHLVPIHAWYEGPADPAEIRARLASIAATLEPVSRSTTEAWMLSTRVVQRRAIRVAPGPSDCAPELIRKFALQLAIEPVSGHGPSGKSTVTAFLRPNAALTDVWTMAGGDAIARVSYVGIPNGLGQARETVVLLTDVLR